MLLVAAAVGKDEEEEVVLNEKGCPKNEQVFKIMPHDNCNQFYMCSNGEPYEFSCPESLVWNPDEGACDWPSQVDCGNRRLPGVNPEAEATPAPSNAVSVCAREGSDGQLVPHEYCNHMYLCARGVPVDIACPEPLLFNADSNTCDWDTQVDCGDRLREKKEEAETDSEEKK